MACEMFKRFEKRDPAEVVTDELPQPIDFKSHRDFVRQTLIAEADLRANGTEIVDLSQDSQASITYRNHMNSEGSPSDQVAAGYIWRPGTELNRKIAVTH